MTTEPKYITSELETTSSHNSVAKFKGIVSLRRRLLTAILPVVLLPLLIASGIGYNLIQDSAKNEIIEELEEDIEKDALLASKIITAFIRDSFEIIDLIAANPDVIQSMKNSSSKVREQRLTQQPISTLEQRFAETKLLTTDNNLNNYLRQIVKSTKVVEILFTEKNGFNLAFSTPPSDFVQRDETWWQITRQEGQAVKEIGFDEFRDGEMLVVSKAVKDSETKEFLGTVRVSVPVETLNNDLGIYLDGEYEQYYQFQILDTQNDFILSNVESALGEFETPEQSETKTEEIKVIGGEPILTVGKTLIEVMENVLTLEEAEQLIDQQFNFAEFKIRQETIFSETSIVALLTIEDEIYSLATVPNTALVSIGAVNYAILPATPRSLITVFALTAIVLGLASIGLIIILAEQLTKPLSNLSFTTQEVANGNLELEANLEGTLETQILANNFNNLIKQVKESLEKQKTLTREQREQKEELEKAIYTLIDEVSDATEGDLTVRASLDSLEMSTVADLFNAIIENLKEIAIETKQSTSQVGSSLEENESEIRFLSDRAIAQARETRDTLESIKQMSQSIREVADNASQAAKITDDTFNTVVSSTNDMDLTVESILKLRTTIGETAKKMKRLGESSQKISQVISFIEEIALKTNVLAINASVEARRAGEYGQGFTIVAEQVGTLAEQSAAATQKIASIVGKIQAETLEVTQAMESGIAQVVNSTKRVESTKEELRLVLEKSQAINQLMESISQKTISQANTSQNVTHLMEEIAQLSEATSISFTRVAQSIGETAAIAKKLESTVAKFKVAQES